MPKPSKFGSSKGLIKKLRGEGKTFGEITQELGFKIPRSTMSMWCSEVKLPDEYLVRLKENQKKNASKGRLIAQAVLKVKREKYLQSLLDRNSSLKKDFQDIHVKKIALAMLYLGEGSKGAGGQVRLGNSDPFVIELFMSLMRECYNADESKFRCAVQCRADQDEQKLKVFWSKVTKVPLTQFYNSRIDKRTIGIPTLKLDYKGVCNIDYFSSEVFLELMQIPKIIFKGPVA